MSAFRAFIHCNTEFISRAKIQGSTLVWDSYYILAILLTQETGSGESFELKGSSPDWTHNKSLGVGVRNIPRKN